MAEINLTQAEADALLAMKKYFVNRAIIAFPPRGHRKIFSLKSGDNREQFLLEIWRGRVDIRKVSLQNRARQSVILLRLDLGSLPHRNPDGQKIASPHLHVYREGDGDRWAIPVPTEPFTSLDNPYKTMAEFMSYCNIVSPPQVQQELPE
ncbi:MAG: hypothetical protein OXG23_09725 [Chloroflexi bacterium]|nr:hypothetical protein [Chloroflexota bacterium]